MNAKGEVASRDVLLKSELAVFVSAMKEAAQGICPKMKGPTGEVQCVSPVHAWSNCKYQEFKRKKSPWYVYRELEEERDNVLSANSAAEQLTSIFHPASSSSRVTSE